MVSGFVVSGKIMMYVLMLFGFDGCGVFMLV